MNDDLPWDPDPKKVNCSALLFEHFFPSVEGKSEVLERFLTRFGSKWKRSVDYDMIEFHRPNADDPDEVVSC